MSAVATWADKMRFTKDLAWTEPMHYVDIRDDLILPNGCPSTSTPLNSTSSTTVEDAFQVKSSAFVSEDPNCVFVYSRDCADGLCAVHAIQQMSNNLHNANQNRNHDDGQEITQWNLTSHYQKIMKKISTT